MFFPTIAQRAELIVPFAPSQAFFCLDTKTIHVDSRLQACWVLCEIGRKPFSPLVVCHMSSKLRHKMLQRLRSREKRVHGADWPDIDESVLEYIVNQARSLWSSLFCSLLLFGYVVSVLTSNTKYGGSAFCYDFCLVVYRGELLR